MAVTLRGTGRNLHHIGAKAWVASCQIFITCESSPLFAGTLGQLPTILVEIL